MNVHFTEIDWETDGLSLEECGLSNECTLDINEALAADHDNMDQFLEEEAANILSDRFGFLVQGCKFEVMKTVTIAVEGGVVQGVDCPKGVRLVVHDYDVDGSESDLHEDESGDEYVENVWE